MIKRRTLVRRAAESNESPCLELSGIGERPGSQRASGSPEAGRPRYPFLVRDKDGQKKDAMAPTFIGNVKNDSEGLRR